MRRCIGLLLGMVVLWSAWAWGQTPLSIVWMRGGIENNPTRLAVHPHRPLVATAQGSLVYIYNASDQTLAQILSLPTSTVQIVFSPDGERLFTATPEGIWVWRVADWSLERTISVSLRDLSLMAVSPDSQLVVVLDTSLRQINAFEAATGTLRFTLTGHTDSILALAFHPVELLLISLGRDGQARYWRVANGGLERTVAIASLQGARGAAISPESSLAAVARDNESRVRLVSLATGAVVREMSAVRPQARLAFSPDGTLLASVADMTDYRMHLWRVSDGEPLYAPFIPYEQGSGPVNALAFTRDGAHLLVAGAHEDIPLWNVAQGVRTGSLPTHPREFPAIGFSSDSRLLWTGSPRLGWLRAFDAATGTLVAAPMRLAEGISTFVFHPTLPILATNPNTSNTVRLWDLTTGEMFLSLPAPRILGFAPDGELLWTLNGPGNALGLWRLFADGIRLETIFGGNGAAGVNPQGTLIAQMQDFRMNLWNARDGSFIRQLPGLLSSFAQSVRFSSNSQYLACNTTAPNQLPVWNLRTNEHFNLSLSLNNNPQSIAFSPDEEFIVATAHDQRLRFWRLRDRALVAEYEHLIFRSVVRLEFSPDGRYIALARRDGTIAVLRNPFFPDLNSDGAVDDSDLLTVLFAFGSTGINLAGDANRDGVVDDADLLMVLFYFGQ